MKKVIAFLLLLTIFISPFLKGLFFEFETSVIFAIISLLSAVYFLVKLLKREKIFLNGWLAVLGSIMVLAAILSFVRAVNIRENVTTLLRYTEYFMAATVIYDFFKDRREILVKTTLICVAVVSFVCAVIGLEVLTGAFNLFNENESIRRIGSTFQYANTAAIFFAVGIIFTLALTSMSEKIIPTMLLAGSGSIIVAAFFLTASRGGCIIGTFFIILTVILQPAGRRLKLLWQSFFIVLPSIISVKAFYDHINTQNYFTPTISLGITAALSILLSLGCFLIYKWLSNIKLSSFLVVAIHGVMALSALALLFVFREKIIAVIPEATLQRLLNLSLNDVSLVARIDLYRYAIRLLGQNWFFGYGGGGWEALYQSVEDEYFIANLVHNHYLEVFVEIGILGFIAFTISVIKAIINYFVSFFKSGEAKERISNGAMLCAFIALALHSVMDFNMSFISVLLLFWVMMAASYTKKGGKDQSMEGVPAVKQAKGSFGRYVVAAVLILVGISQVFFNGWFGISSWHALKGERYMEAENYEASLESYKKAHELDPHHWFYNYNMAKLYHFFAGSETDSNKIQEYSELALDYAGRSVADNPENPAALELLVVNYLDAGLPLEALPYAEKLVANQRCGVNAHELLAKTYLNASRQYMMQQNIPMAGEVLNKASLIENTEYVKLSSNTLFYKAQSLLFLENYPEAESVLKNVKKTNEVEKIDIDTLFYVIYQFTGREEEINKKYKAEALEDMESTMLYAELYGVIDSRILYNIE